MAVWFRLLHDGAMIKLRKFVVFIKKEVSYGELKTKFWL